MRPSVVSASKSGAVWPICRAIEFLSVFGCLVYAVPLWHDSASVKIAAVHTAVVEGNYDWTFVRIDADDGLRGLGECYCAPGLTAIVRDLAPLLVGEDPRDVDRLWSKLRWGASGAGSSAGIVYNAISGMEAALWDLVGRALRRADPPPARRPVPRLGPHVRRLPRRRGARVDGRDDGRAPGALGAGAARGDRGRRDPRARARPRVRQGARPTSCSRPSSTRARAREVVAELGLQRAEVRPRRPDAVHAGHRVGHAQPRRDRRDGRARRRGDRRGRAPRSTSRSTATGATRSPTPSAWRTSSSRSACCGSRTRCRRRTSRRCAA